VDPTLAIVALTVGLFLLVAGGDLLVARSARLANYLHVPKAVVGAIVIGFGTSLPELFVSLTAALNDSPGIALGNVVGSNIANIGLILGTGAVLATLRIQRSVLRVDLPLGVLASVILIAWLGPRGSIDQFGGAALLALFAVYLFLNLRATRRHQKKEAPAEVVWRPVQDTLGIIGGLVAILVGAKLLVGGAVDVARWLTIDEEIIGLSIVALGTSLPELAAIVAAVRLKETDLAVGNVAGSNLFNLLFVLGATAVVHPVPVSAHALGIDFKVLALFSVLAFPIFSRARRMGRVHGVIHLGAYLAYNGSHLI
jgi:cation:H+ antiporter